MLQYFKKSGKSSATASAGPDEAVLNEAAAIPVPDLGSSEAESLKDSKPVLSDEDESFLLRVASEAEPPPLPPRPVATEPAPTSSKESSQIDDGAASKNAEESRLNNARVWAEKWIEWGIKPTQDLAMQKIQELSVARQTASLERQKASDRRLAADTLKAAADTVKTQAKLPDPEVEEEVKEESKEIGTILSRLDLSSINNRVVGVSKETQKLLEAFNQVLKDIVNGVPTAYGDLEKLLTDRQSQLEKLYGGLPPFLQGLVQTIPVKVYAMLAPQVAAAMAMEEAKTKDDPDTKKKKKSRTWIPTLKSLVGTKGSGAAMLRSIIGFLEMRFPALLAGTNVIVSLAVFILLFVFWYCHKRGRETRLSKAGDGSIEESDGDDESLCDLEKGPGLEQSQQLAIEDGQPTEMKALPAVDDADIEKNVDVLMEQLSKPIEKKDMA